MQQGSQRDYYIQMGNSEDWVKVDSCFKSEQELLQSLIPIDDGENSNEMLGLGRFKIYRFRSEPYEMLMKHVRIFTPDNPKCDEYSSMARAVGARIDHKNVARIHCINICTRSSICIKQTSIQSYANYYALNLEQVITQRKANDTRFTAGELWYVINSLIELALYLQKFQIYFGVYLARNVFLSPEGYIKVYLYHLDPQQKHLLYYHMIASDCREAYKMPSAPQAQSTVAAWSERVEDGGIRDRYGSVRGNALQLYPQVLLQPLCQLMRPHLRRKTTPEGLQRTQGSLPTCPHLSPRIHGAHRPQPPPLSQSGQRLHPLYPRVYFNKWRHQAIVGVGEPAAEAVLQIHSGGVQLHPAEHHPHQQQQRRQQAQCSASPTHQQGKIVLQHQQLQEFGSQPARTECGTSQGEQVEPLQLNQSAERQQEEGENESRRGGKVPEFFPMIIASYYYYLRVMEQAYQFFNAGKYKEALNSLSSNPSNIDSYEPNLCVCEYMANRCQQSALNTLKKMNDLVTRKYKREGNRTDPQTENILKLNIAVLLILQGRRDSALPLLREIYQNRHCFIEFMQTRIFLLLLELNVTLKNPFEVLTLHRYYLLRPAEPKLPHQQWMSVILHEHGKTYLVVKEEFTFLTNAYLNQALMQVGVPVGALTGAAEDQRLREELLGRIKRRKNGISKYYEINVIMISRFLEAQKELYARNLQRCLSLMNFVNMSEEYEQMPTTKIITNILSGFANSNTGIVHFLYQKPAIAITYFAKAKTLLTKACTGVEDRELHILSLNYSNYLEAVTFNQALCLLNYKPKEAYQYFDSIRKSNSMSRNYKFWYRLAQSVLDYYHDPTTPQEHRRALLATALNALTNALTCVDRAAVPSLQEIRKITRGVDLQDDQVETIILRLRGELEQFRHSIYALICYVSLGLQLYRRVVTLGRKALEDPKMDSLNRLNIMYYVIEAELCLGKSNYQLQPLISGVQQEAHPYFKAETRIVYSRKGQESFDTVDYETVFYYQLFLMFVGEGNYNQALKSLEFLRRKMPTKNSEFLADAVNYLHLHFHFDKRYVHPFKKPT